MNIKMKITKSVNANGLNSPVGSIVTMDIEEYLKCVVPNEMSNYYPSAALQAQAGCCTNVCNVSCCAKSSI